MDGSIIGAGLNTLFNMFIAFVILAILGVAYFSYSVFKTKEIRTTTKPTISWELKSKGQTVDTVWIYKFEK